MTKAAFLRVFGVFIVCNVIVSFLGSELKPGPVLLACVLFQLGTACWMVVTTYRFARTLGYVRAAYALGIASFIPILTLFVAAFLVYKAGSSAEARAS
jgi:hypothetical protein